MLSAGANANRFSSSQDLCIGSARRIVGNLHYRQAVPSGPTIPQSDMVEKLGCKDGEQRMPIVQLLAKAAFDPESAEMLAAAFDAAWDTIRNTLAAAENADAARERLAKRIIEMAQRGERDPKRLVDDAVSYVFNLNLLSPLFIDDPNHWRQRAEEARTLAEQMSDEGSRQTMLRIARDYDGLAESAEARARDS